MKFPMICVSPAVWEQEHPDPADFMLFEAWIETDNDKIFDRYFRDRVYCDCEGKLFKVLAKKEVKDPWKKWFRFIPNFYRVELIIEPLNETMALSELQAFLLARIEYEGFQQFIRGAKSIEELLNSNKKESAEG